MANEQAEYLHGIEERNGNGVPCGKRVGNAGDVDGPGIGEVRFPTAYGVSKYRSGKWRREQVNGIVEMKNGRNTVLTKEQS